MKIKKRIIIILFILSMVFLIYFDYVNIITNLGLSVSLWSGFITGIFPIFLTIYLWKIEQNERISQINEESNFQKKLTIRSTYIEYFENLLEQINEYSIFLKSCLLSDKSMTEEELDLDSRIKIVINFIRMYSRYEVWKINYRIYAFKGIDIDIFNYEYNDKIINLKTFMPYIDLSNKLTAIYEKRKNTVNLSGIGYVDINNEEQEEIAKEILKKQDEVKELYDLLIYLKNDIEKQIAFD